MPCFRLSVFALLAAGLAACGGGGGDSGSAPAPPETLYVPANVWHGATIANAEMVSPEEFRSRQGSGTISITTTDNQQSQSKAHQDHIASELSFLDAQSDLSDDIKALLTAAHNATDLNAVPTLTLPSGSTVALLDLGTRVEMAADLYRRSHDPAEALATYKLSYTLLTDEQRASLPTPDSLAGATLDAIQAATVQLDAAAATALDIDGTRIDTDEQTSGAAARITARVKDAGNGHDGPTTACAPAGYAKLYWYPLKSFISPIRDQARRGTCWAFTAMAAVESRELVQNNNVVNLSEQYFVEKYKHQWYPDDYNDGASAAAGLNYAVNNNQLLVTEDAWTYNPSSSRTSDAEKAGVVGTKDSYVGACIDYSGDCSETSHQSKYVCTNSGGYMYCAFTLYASVGGLAASTARLVWSPNQAFNLNQLRSLLANGVSLIGTLPIYQGFDDATGSGGIVTNYDKKTTDDKGMLVDGDRGSHQLQVVGFISNEQLQFPGAAPVNIGGGGYFILRNSWGCVGDGGFYYVPADYVSTLFTSLEALDLDGTRSAQWNTEQLVPGSTDGLNVTAGNNPTVDLRVQTDIASAFTVTHPVANYVHLTVTSGIDGQLYDGLWLVNAPGGASLFHNTLPVTFVSEGPRTIFVTATYGTQKVTSTFTLNVYNSPPVISFANLDSPVQGTPFQVVAVVSDKNESTPFAMCLNMTWSVTPPDTIVSGNGCNRMIQFAATGNRSVTVSTFDSEGKTASATDTLLVGPAPANPYPIIDSFGVFSRDSTGTPGQFNYGCVSNPVIDNNQIDLRESGCSLNLLSIPTQYFAKVVVDNPSAEALSYDWTLTLHYPNEALYAPVLYTAHTTTNSSDLTDQKFGAAGTPYNCTVDVRVNAPDATRSKTVRVWSGRCVDSGEPGPH